MRFIHFASTETKELFCLWTIQHNVVGVVVLPATMIAAMLAPFYKMYFNKIFLHGFIFTNKKYILPSFLGNSEIIKIVFDKINMQLVLVSRGKLKSTRKI